MLDTAAKSLEVRPREGLLSTGHCFGPCGRRSVAFLLSFCVSQNVETILHECMGLAWLHATGVGVGVLQLGNPPGIVSVGGRITREISGNVINCYPLSKLNSHHLPFEHCNIQKDSHDVKPMCSTLCLSI